MGVAVRPVSSKSTRIGGGQIRDMMIGGLIIMAIENG